MALYLVLLSTILAFSLASRKQLLSSPGSNINLSLDSMKNDSGHSISKVDTRRYTMKENSRPLPVNVHQEAGNETEKLLSVDTVHPSLHDTSMSGTVQPTGASTSTSTAATTTPKSCPHSGYQLFPEFNCYKAFPSYDEWMTWSEAREQCKRDGGDLMVMETERERTDVYIPLYNSVSWDNWPWVGVYVAQGGDSWMTVKGEPALSTWWAPGEPDGNAANKCALADFTGLLGNLDCAILLSFICEIPL